jgi:hypothetical protein
MITIAIILIRQPYRLRGVVRPSLTLLISIALACMTSGQRRSMRTSSSGEVGYLRRLVQAHGRNVAAMARDIKLNVDQKTAGQLQRAIEKAGGFVALER